MSKTEILLVALLAARFFDAWALGKFSALLKAIERNTHPKYTDLKSFVKSNTKGEPK